MYKLKQWYPGLPKCWKGMDNIHVYKKDGYKYYKEIGVKSSFELETNQVEDNPEFWEKVEEKDYEILKFKSSRTGNITTSDWRPMGSEEWKIYSVKRVNDGEIFVVGDYIASTKGYEATIERMLEANGKLYVYGKGKGNPSTIMQIRHAKRRTPLTTEDGVDVPHDFCGRLFYVNLEFSKFVDMCDLGSDMAKHKETKFFDKKSNAIQYIEDEQKQYSKNDLRRMLEL